MKRHLYFIGLLVAIQAISKVTASSRTDDEGFIVDSNCNDAFDCYVHDSGLSLACYYNINKCKCRNTFRSIYNLESIDNRCVMSKYGPCGVRGNVEVGCSDGFVCIEDRCRDPNDNLKTVKATFEFDTGSCRSCKFSEELQLECEGGRRGGGRERCLCEELEIADARGKLWDLRNYDGNKNCSVSQYGPCGERNGVKIDCHGDGIECVDGTCTNPKRPTSALNEPCEETKNCDSGLICARNSYQCIKPKSSQSGTSCYDQEECAEGLICGHFSWDGPWSNPHCHDPADELPPHPQDY